MIVSFKNKSLKNFFLKGESSKINPAHVKKLRLILAKLHGAKTIQDLNYPGGNLHPLKGDFLNYWSLTVSGNWRLIFQFEKGEVHLIDYIDYH